MLQVIVGYGQLGDMDGPVLDGAVINSSTGMASLLRTTRCSPCIALQVSPLPELTDGEANLLHPEGKGNRSVGKMSGSLCIRGGGHLAAHEG